MKKILCLLVVAVMMIGVFAACAPAADAPAPAPGDAPADAPADAPGDAPAAPADPEGVTGFLRVWSFTDEVERHVAVFRSIFPGVEVEYMITDMDGGAYEEWILTAMAAGGDHVPDVVYLEAAFVRTMVEAPLLRDLSHFEPLARELETFQFTIDVGTADDEIRAWSFQATPGGMFYRRSMAQEIFGVSEPDDVQQLFRDIPTALDSARRIRDEGGGTMFFTNHYGAFADTFYSNRTQPWIVDNTLTIDQMALNYMDFARTIREEGLDANVGNWSEQWFASMQDAAVDAAGNEMRIFSYMLPTWGLAHVVYQNHEGNFGDWAIIPGPQPYQWGGTWLGVPRVANNVDLAELFIQTITLNEEVLANWALGVYTNEYLTSHAVNAYMHEGVHQGGGDFVSSARVVREIAHQFDGGNIYNFLGGQNPYTIWMTPAAELDLSLLSAADSEIQGAFGEALDGYIDGTFATRDEAIAFFRTNVGAAIPGLNVN